MLNKTYCLFLVIMDLVTVNEARKIIEKEIFHLESIEKDIVEALFYYNIEDIYSPIDVPPFDNSAMDGYAFAYKDFLNYGHLQTKHTIKAGDIDIPENKEQEAVRIFTGAAIPKGADTVVMQEFTEIKDNELFIRKEIHQGDNIRLKGSQNLKNELVMRKKTFINSGTIGFLASLGISKIKIYPLPKVSILITGNELVEAGEKLQNGQIYESNSKILISSLKKINFNIHSVYKVNDEKDSILEMINEIIEESDILLVTGGISVGNYDFVRDAIKELEKSKRLNTLFYKVKQKPGKPLYFGKFIESEEKTKYIFALPGNPASVFSCFYLYVKPFLEGVKGKLNSFDDNEVAHLTQEYRKKTDYTHFLKGKKDKKGNVNILENQESYKMNPFLEADCLIEITKEENNKGEKVTLWEI